MVIVFVLDGLKIVANEKTVLVHPALVGARQQEPLKYKALRDEKLKSTIAAVFSLTPVLCNDFLCRTLEPTV